MTASQRKRQNQLNSAKSTGPVTSRGKSCSSHNSLKHGFCAEKHVLPTESPEAIQAEADEWFTTLEPEGTEEVKLVNQVALDALRIERIAKAETEILAEQIRNAETQWDLDRDHRLIDTKRFFDEDPAKAVAELKSFAAGAEWLLEQWLTVQEAFQTFGYLNSITLIARSLKLQGINPRRLAEESHDAHNFATRCLSAIPREEQTREQIEELARTMSIDKDWKAVHAKRPPSGREESIKVVGSLIDSQIAALHERVTRLKAAETASRAGAETRATVLEATPKNQLMLRYATSLQSDLRKTLDKLEKLRQNREYEPENEPVAAVEEAPKPELRNEAEIEATSTATHVHIGAYVKMNGMKYEVYDTGDGFIYLAPIVDEPVPTHLQEELSDSDDVSPPLTGV